MWMQYQKNPTLALENYMNALSLGGTKTLPELYQTAGISFDFSSNYVKTLMDFTRDELEKLYQ
jgi:oligoendopeptidase F